MITARKLSVSGIYDRPTMYRTGVLKPIGSAARLVGIIRDKKDVNKDMDPYLGFYLTKAELVDRKRLSSSQKKQLAQQKKFKRGHLYLATVCTLDKADDGQDRVTEREIFVTASDLIKAGIHELPRDNQSRGTGNKVIASKKLHIGGVSQFWGELRVMAKEFHVANGVASEIKQIENIIKNHPERVDRAPIPDFTENRM